MEKEEEQEVSVLVMMMRTLASPGLSAGLGQASQEVYRHLTLGITVTEFVDGQRHAVTVPLIDWTDVSANTFHVTEEFSVLRTGGQQRYRPDIVCLVNGIPLAPAFALALGLASLGTGVWLSGLRPHAAH